MKRLDEACVLIPAAGFGVRVGRPAAKELLADQQGQPMIDFALSQAWQLRARPVVITRKQKTSLIEYLHSHKHFREAGKLILIDASKEWPDTLLQSQAEWSDRNLLILPDVRWRPEDITTELLQALDECDLAVAEHPVEDPSKWGVVVSDSQSLTIQNLTIKEKVPAAAPAMAWGLLAFRKTVGRALFEAQLQSTLTKAPVALQKISVRKFKLEHFEDLTRG